MSLADLVPIALASELPRRSRAIGRTEINRRYRQKHLAKYNAYRRQWWHSRKAA